MIILLAHGAEAPNHNRTFGFVVKPVSLVHIMEELRLRGDVNTGECIRSA